jgi:hypothetical protein
MVVDTKPYLSIIYFVLHVISCFEYKKIMITMEINLICGRAIEKNKIKWIWKMWDVEVCIFMMKIIDFILCLCCHCG